MESVRQIRYLVESYYDVQKLRVETFNRIVACAKSHLPLETQKGYASRTKDEPPEGVASPAFDETHRTFASQNGREPQLVTSKPSEIAKLYTSLKIEPPKEIGELVWYHNSLYETEKQLAKKLAGWSKHHKLRLNYLGNIQGIGPILSSGLIAWLEPISRFSNISKLWSYCGLSAIHWRGKCSEGHRFITSSEKTECPVKKKNEKCKGKIVSMEFHNSPMKRVENYVVFANFRLRTLLWKIATSFEKQNSEKSVYRRVYERQKAYYQTRMKGSEEKGVKGHIRNMTLRYVAKMFLADLWLVWRGLEGLPITKPYSVAVAGHADFREPVTDKDV